MTPLPFYFWASVISHAITCTFGTVPSLSAWALSVSISRCCPARMEYQT